MKLTVAQAVNRGNNLVFMVFGAVLAVAFIADFLTEDKILFKLDDAACIAIGLVMVAWFFVGDNKYRRSLQPLALFALGTVAKIGGVALEFGDAADLGDDTASVIAFVILLVILAAVYRLMAPPPPQLA